MAGKSTASPPSPEMLHGDMRSLWQQLQRIRERAEALEARFESELRTVHPNFAASARNLDLSSALAAVPTAITPSSYRTDETRPP